MPPADTQPPRKQFTLSLGQLLTTTLPEEAVSCNVTPPSDFGTLTRVTALRVRSAFEVAVSQCQGVCECEFSAQPVAAASAPSGASGYISGVCFPSMYTLRN